MVREHELRRLSRSILPAAAPSCSCLPMGRRQACRQEKPVNSGCLHGPAPIRIASQVGGAKRGWDRAASPSRTNAWNVQPHLVEAASSAEVQRLSIVIPPGHVVRVLRGDDRSQMLSLGRNDPQTTRTGHIQVAALVHLHAVECVFARCGRHIEENLAVHSGPRGRQRPDYPTAVRGAAAHSGGRSQYPREGASQDGPAAAGTGGDARANLLRA